jgi:hypothetical protein
MSMSITKSVPPSVRNATFAVWAMLALLLLRTVLTFAFTDDLVDAWIEDNESAKLLPRDLAEAGAPRYTAVAIGVLIVGIVLAFAAINLRKAARWARIVAVIFAALSLLGVVVSLIAPTITVLLIINVVVGLLAAAVMALLFTTEANRFFAH